MIKRRQKAIIAGILGATGLFVLAFVHFAALTLLGSFAHIFTLGGVRPIALA